MGKIIGIDLGTTNSVCAYMDRAEPRVIINEEGGRVTPSVVGFSRNGERFVGDVAKRQMLINPLATIHSIKRFMGKKFRDSRREQQAVNYLIAETASGDCGVEIEGRVYTPQEISAMVLQKLRRSAEDHLGESVTEAVITVPAYFTDSQRQATRDAATIAGLDCLRIINEPTAAALAYVHERKRRSTIAVYDFGGGTFDISLLEVDRDVAEVLATRGNNALGGADLDRRIVEWLVQRFQEENDLDVSNDAIVMQRLRDAAERAKLELSTATTTEIHLPFLVADSSGPRHLQTALTRATFERLAESHFQETVSECKKAMKDAGLRPGDLDEIIMVGGSSRIPRVQELVQGLFRRNLNKGFNPDEVVAVGAAINAGILEGEVKAVTLLDVTNFSLGIEVQGRRFAKLIEKNTTIPTQKTQLVSTVIDNQKTVKIHVLQGEKPMAQDNVSLGEFELTNIQASTRGAPRIQVQFSIDTNGIVNVAAEDLRTGITEKITIEAPTGLSKVEIDRMKEEADAAEAKTNVEKALKGLRDQVERKLVVLEELLRENKPRLHKKDIFEVEQALKRGRMALIKSQDRKKINELLTYISRYHTHLEHRLNNS